MRAVLSPTRLLIAAVAIAGSTVAGCGDDDDPDPAADTTEAPVEAASDGIVAEDFALTSASAAPGDAVSVTNEDTVAHTVTADDGSFDSGQIGGGATGEISAPEDPGDYAYHCEIHPSMTGTLTVEG